MIKVTFKTYSEILKKSFVNEKIVKSMADFNLYALALFHGRVEILSTKAVS